MDELVFTTNSLSDIVNWLKKGYMICIYNENNCIFYYWRETVDTITDEKIVYIDVSKNPGLLEDDEWPFYIESEGFLKYKNWDNIPTNTDHIFHLKI